MNILLIISPYLPAQTPNTIRWTALIREFTNKGHKLYVLTTKLAGEENVSIDKNISTYRTGHHTLLDAFYNFTGKTERRNISSEKRRGNSGMFRRVLEKIVDNTWRRLYWPDGSVLFFKPGKKLARKLIKENEITHVISVGLPYTNHLIAQSLKKENKELIWLMDIQDPFSYSDIFRINNRALYKSKNLKSEESCFQLANKVVVTNQNAKTAYERLFDCSVGKTSVIPPIFAEIAYSQKTINEDEKIRIAFMGNFYENVRSPEAFLDFLSRIDLEDPAILSNYQFHFFGDHGHFVEQVFKRYPMLNDLVYLESYKARSELFEMVSRFDLLINFGNKTNYHLPSKLVDFLFLQKPVINISLLKDDLSNRFLKGRVELMTINLSETDYNENRNNFLDFISRRRRSNTVSLNAVSEYLPAKLAMDYIELLM